MGFKINSGKSIAYRVLLLLAACFCCILFLIIWTDSCEASAHRDPTAVRVNIESILDKEEWSLQDYELLTAQTGLACEVLEVLSEQGRREELIRLQEEYFRPVNFRCEPNSIISKEEYVADEQGLPVKGMTIPYVEEGDILITFCSHAFGWRNGHVGLVVDAEKRLVLEAQVLGTPTVVTSLDHWESYPSFMVFRLEDAEREERAAIAAYAMEYLVDVPYRLTAGILGGRMPGGGAAQKGELVQTTQESLSGTQCAHMVWYAYRQFGYDLDSDGGLIVTPRDLAESRNLKIIQKYGVQ